MVKRSKVTGRAMNMPAGVALGTVLSLLITIVGAGFMAWLVQGEKLAENGIGYGSVMILLVASILGPMAAGMLVKHRKQLVNLITGFTYLVTLVVLNLLLFGGRFEGLWAGVLLILAGSGCTILLGLRQGSGGMKRRHKPWTG